MKNNTDEIKGRVKQAAGDLTGNKDLQREGQQDRLAGRVKDAIEDVKEKAENTVDALKDRVHELSNRDS